MILAVSLLHVNWKQFFFKLDTLAIKRKWSLAPLVLLTEPSPMFSVFLSVESGQLTEHQDLQPCPAMLSQPFEGTSSKGRRNVCHV